MKFGLGLGSDLGHVGLLGRAVPAWVLRSTSGIVPLFDVDLANGRYYGALPTNIFAVSRASDETTLLPWSASGASYSTFGSNTLAINPGYGLQGFSSRTQLLANPLAPATQTTASLGTGTYCLWVNGAGSATSSAGTATGSGFGAATNGSPNIFTLSGAGTVTVTVSGALNVFQLAAGGFGTPFIPSGTGAADAITATGVLDTLLKSAQGSIIAKAGMSAQTAASGRLIGSTTSVAPLTLRGAAPTEAFATFNGSVTLGGLANTFNIATGFRTGAVGWDASGRDNCTGGGTVATDANGFGSISTGYILSQNGTASFFEGVLARIVGFSSRLSATDIKTTIP